MTWGSEKRCRCWRCWSMRRREKAGPALVVVPRSLVFNWKAEALRFTPDMRVLDHTGINRTRAADHFANFDLIVTTYGTLAARRGVPQGHDFRLRHSRRSAGDQEFQYGSRKGDALAARPASAGADGHADRKSARRICGACSSSSIPACWAPFRSFARWSEMSTVAEGRAGSCPRPAAFHSSPHQAAGCDRSSREARADDLLRSRRATAETVRRAARTLSPVAADTRR